MTGTVYEGDAPGGATPRARVSRRSEGYWRANQRLQLTLLGIWALFGYVLSIFLAGPLNELTMYGFPLGFWFAQQGAIYVFVILIFVYALKMDRVDREYDVHEEEEELGASRKALEQRMHEAPAAAAGTGDPSVGTTSEPRP